jgi:hypothetical protein
VDTLVDLVERVLADEVVGIDGETPQKLDVIFNGTSTSP